MAAGADFLLGIDFPGQGFDHYAGSRIASDNSGSLYVFDVCTAATTSVCVTKLAADGKTVVWQHEPDAGPATMAVDPNGGVYVTVADPFTEIQYVEKLKADSDGAAWKVPVAWGLTSALLLTVDPQGRAYVAYNQPDGMHVVRVSADGSARDYMVVWGQFGVQALTADGAGSAILLVSGPLGTGPFLTKLSNDGTSQLYSTPVSTQFAGSLIADAAGNVTALLYDSLAHFNAQGEQTFLKALPGLPWPSRQGIPGLSEVFPAITLDSAGNIYVVGAFLAHGVKNSLAACGGTSLLVYAPDGSTLQGTYLPDTTAAVNPSITVSGSAVYIAKEDGLTRLSQNSAASTLPLACVTNAASFAYGPVAPGEIVALYGNGLGPQVGIQTQATMDAPFPKQAGNVEVTFDGAPAPLLWVQDGQINAVAPWSLTPGQNTSICVSNSGVKTNCLSQPVAQTAPGVFTTDGFKAVALNQDGTVNSADNPAHLQTVVTIYATGLGPINPALPDGALVGLPLPANVLPVNIDEVARPDQMVSGVTIDYAGPAPDELNGLTQINLRLDGSLPPPPLQLGNVFGLNVALVF
jgi:uncharacterized protein (TIGR03437 family)